MSSETAEDLLAYRKADLIFSFAPTANRSICCSHFKTVPIVVVCSKFHPRLGETCTPEELAQENFTFYDTSEAGVRQFQASLETVLPVRNIAFRSDSFISNMNMISVSELVGLIPLRAYETMPFLQNSSEKYQHFKRCDLFI